MALILLFLSIAPVAFFAYQIYKRDFDKEPGSILVKLFCSGIGSAFLTLFISFLLQKIVPFFGYDTTSLDVIELIPYVFIGIALVEEFSKWIFVYKLEYNDNEFNHLYDGIVYAAFVSLGFACFENILYVMQSGVQTAIVRALLAIPGHLCDGIMMGYYLSMAKLALCNNNKTLSKKNLILSLLIPTLAHGIYDYLIFASDVSDNGLFMLAFFAFIAFFFTYASQKVKQLSTNVYNLNPNYVSITARKKQNMVGGYVQQPVNNIYNQYTYPQGTVNPNYNNNGYPQSSINNVYPYNNYQQPINNNYNQYTYPQGTINPNYINNSYPQPSINNNSIKYCNNCGNKVFGKYCDKCGKQV